jgi:sulfhydrogenase subunit beta (sulfur reductase)
VVTAMLYQIESSAVQSLIEVLRQAGYTVLGPTQRDGVIAYDEIQSSNDLPKGWTDEQRPGHYRLHQKGDSSLFEFTLGPHSWKKFLFPPTIKLFSAYRSGKAITLPENGNHEKTDDATKFAFLGVRSCELHAIGIQDKVFVSATYQDPHYRNLRQQLFIVAVNCTKPAETCFCSSMNTGPKVSRGFDLALMEIVDKDHLYYVVEVGSEAGARVLQGIDHRPARDDEITRSETIIRTASDQMKRSLDTTNIKELLYQNSEHPEWEKVAARCLTCTNCTMVCPTCFCHTIDDTTDFPGNEATRNRRWDSCFTLDFSYIHGGSVRVSTKARYRHWMTHKLASWIDQFGIMGCVGCGRCITWCPVGIDITEEARLIRENKEPE